MTTATAETADWMVVGHCLTTEEQFNALPNGSVVELDGTRQRYTKEGGRWKIDNTDKFMDGSHSFTMGSNTVVSLPEGTVLTKNQEARIIESVEELAGLRAGTVIQTQVPGHSKATWTVLGDGRLQINTGGNTLPVEHFSSSIRAGQCTIGVKPEVGQVYNDGGYVYLLVEHMKDGWYMASFSFRSGRWNTAMVQPEPPGTLVAAPDWMTDQVKWMAQVTVQNWRALGDRDKTIRDLNQKVADLEAGGTNLRRAFSQIEKGRVEKDNLRSYIDTVLSENGIKTLDQTITVTATVRISQYITIPPEDLRPHIPNIGKDEVVHAGRQLLTYDRKFDKDVDVEPGQCGCRQITNTHMREWVAEEGLTDLYSHTLVERTCESESCVYKPRTSEDPF